MNTRTTRAALLAAVCLPMLLAGCGGFEFSSLIPGATTKEVDLTKAPVGALAYQCSGGKRLFVRYLDNGAAWVILPDREFRLDKDASAAGRYSNGSTTLFIAEAGATLSEGTAVTYADCKKN